MLQVKQYGMTMLLKMEENSGQSAVNILEPMSVVSQFMPSSKFSPVTALQEMICQWWVLIRSSSKA